VKRELVSHAIVELFQQELEKMSFIEVADREDVAKKLQILCDDKIPKFRKSRTAGELWKYFFTKSLSALTDNLRGSSELCRYFDEYIDYEDLLFAVDERHRDHIIHSIWVMLLGFYLRKCYEIFDTIDYSDCLAELEDFDEEFGKLVGEVRKYEQPLWCMIALTHDLGYPIEKTKLANEKMSKMISNYGFLRQTDFNYDFTIVHQAAIDELLSCLSTVVVRPGRKNLYKLGHVPGFRLDYARSFEKLDHGIMSAYLLQNHLDWICDAMLFVRGLETEIGHSNITEVAKMVVALTLLRSISSHTNRYRYFTVLNNMQPLLLLCDELEEFSRYARSPETHEWVEVGRRTELECRKDLLQMYYTFDNRDVEENVKEFFISKVKSIHKRFQLSTDNIKEVSITCKDVTKADNIICTFKKKLGAKPKATIKVGRKKSEDITNLID